MFYNKNDVIYTIREVCGDEAPDGFYLTIDDDTKVPNYLYQDGKSEYPEIRISPFITNAERLSLTNKISQRWRNIKDIYKADFQIDMYSTSVAEVNKIYRALELRIEKLLDTNTIIYGYNSDYIDMTDYYKNSIYEDKNFILGWVSVENQILEPICDVKNLINNSWYLGDDGLYIKTDLDITTVKVMSIYDERIFPDNTTLYSRGVFDIKITNAQNMSDLEKNEVERIMMEINVIYGLVHQRKDGPLIENIDIGAKNDK